MFRVKISPQVVITVQSAIPKIVVTLILVTFSYAIAGFFVDLMYVIIGLLSVIMAPIIPHVALLSNSSYTASDVFNMLTIGPVTKMAGVQTASAGGIWALLSSSMGPLIILAVVFLLIGMGIGIVTSTIAGAGLLVIIVSLILFIVFVVILLWMGIKVIWTLFKAFANIVLLTIFSPLYLTLGIVIPSFSFGQWARTYFSHLAVFVTTGVLWLFSWIFMLEAWASISDGIKLTNLASGTAVNPWPPLLGAGGGLFFVYMGVSFVLFTLIPKASDLVQSFLSGKPFAYGTALGETFAPLSWAYGRTLGPGVADYQKYQSANMLKGIFGAFNQYLENHPDVKQKLGGVGEFVSSQTSGYDPNRK